MPDWISHILIVLIIAQVFNIKKRGLLVLGALLPDILGKLKMLNMFFENLPPSLAMITSYGHRPSASLIAALIIALFFAYPYIKTSLLIGAGVITHFLSDGIFGSFLFKGYIQQYFSILIWHDQYYIILIFTLAIYAILRKFDIRWRSKNESTVKTS